MQNAASSVRPVPHAAHWRGAGPTERPHVAQKRASSPSGAPHAQRAGSGGVHERPEQRVDCRQLVVDLEQFLAALAHQVLAEMVPTEHLEQQSAEIAQPFLAELEQRAPLAAQHARRRDRAPRPGSGTSKDRAHAVPGV